MAASRCPIDRSTPSTAPQPHYNPDTGDWDGQLVDSDPVAQVPADRPLPDRKTGGPLDRKQWMRPARQTLTNKAYVLLDALADYADTNGRCFPSQTTLRGDCNQSRSGIQASTRELIKTGWVEIEASGQGRTSTHYRLTGWRNNWNREAFQKSLRGLAKKPLRILTNTSEDSEESIEPHKGTLIKEPVTPTLPPVAPAGARVGESEKSFSDPGSISKCLDCGTFVPPTRTDLCFDCQRVADRRVHVR